MNTLFGVLELLGVLVVMLLTLGFPFALIFLCSLRLDRFIVSIDLFCARTLRWYQSGGRENRLWYR